VGDFNIPHHQKIGYPNKKSINSRTKPHHRSNGRTDDYRIFHPTSTQYTFFSAAHGTFSKIDHILGDKASLSKYKKIEVILCILSDNNALKLDSITKQQQQICKHLEAQ
jgi:exonuclease III